MSLIDILRWYDPVKLPKYPHLSFVDSRLWGTFLNSGPQGIEKVAYDVIVGKGRLASPNSTPNQKKNWQYLTSLKIDVLARTKLGYWIFECKHEANCESLGQILTYSFFLTTQFKISDLIRKTILCDKCHPDMISPCHHYGVDILEIGSLQQFPMPDNSAGWEK